MPSDPRTDTPDVSPGQAESQAPSDTADAVRRLFGPAAEAHRSALASALEEAKGTLRSLRSTGNGRAARAAEELGALSLGPMDPERFAALLDPDEEADPVRLRHFEKAVSVLEGAVEAGAVLETSPRKDETLQDAVARALREGGRGFGAVRVLALLRTGAFQEGEHEGLLEGLPFREWRSLERELAPPLVLSVRGADLTSAGGLAEFLDGSQKIVLLVEEPCPPAPLARLIVPGAAVLQTHDVQALEELAGFPGPGIAALVPETSAAFLHLPKGEGEESAELQLRHVPESPPRGWVGGVSPAQQAADLRLLQAWSRRAPEPSDAPATAGEAGGRHAEGASSAPDDRASSPASEPAERLAAWLLSQAELDDAEGT